jgi:DNA-binding response OmpR family regulator
VIKGIGLKVDTDLTVLMIEGRRGNHPSFTEEMQEKNYRVHRVPSGSAGLAELADLQPDLVVVDAASLRTSGVRICQSFRKADSALPIFLIVARDVSLPDDVDANLVLRLPFTVQKLINRARAFRPTADKFILEAGPIELNIRTQLVRCHDRQKKLTPRLVAILRILMENQGEVVQRDPLFTEVWQTEYTEDTRTLDVHISWLRKAIEDDPHNPQMIKTVRGVGYVLKV